MDMKTTFMWSTLGIRYLGGLRRCNNRVQQPRKPPSNEFLVVMLQFSIKLSEMMFMRYALSTRYLGGRRRCHICVQRPQKPLCSKTGLISINIYGVVTKFPDALTNQMQKTALRSVLLLEKSRVRIPHLQLS
ncbi:hypothetical protein TSAR_001476 [Trichomalopsis sarcophagae]|uniref:Uncharacterized protein n=1 Tax=Trichomalopsis sarcophagae TaxID=543379 RepID=A0A232EHQ9_9HYME|nr:hypothetical protein TSAR_001476 [Trichomalopsis sarcophagae]